MKTRLLTGLSLLGLCGLVIAATPIDVRAGGACPPGGRCPQEGYARSAPCGHCGSHCCFGCFGNCFGNCCACLHHGHGNKCCLEAIKCWALCPKYYICPPDYGWVSPAQVPVARRNVSYYRYWPEHWYGTGSPNPNEYRSYPTVYQPTDTTQLGYTYQHVPTWQPQAGRVPPAPVPSQWHVRECHYGYTGRWHDSSTPIHHHQPPRGTVIVEPLYPGAMKHMPMHAAPTMPPAPEPSKPQPAVIPEPPFPTPVVPEPAPAPQAKSADKVAPNTSAMRTTTAKARS